MPISEIVQAFGTLDGLLPTDPEPRELGEPFAVAVDPRPGVVVCRWALIPKPTENGKWFPSFWRGLDDNGWTTTNGDVPEVAHRFANIAEATAAYLASVDNRPSLSEGGADRG